MDEEEYQSVLDNQMVTSCVFEKSILSLKTECSKAAKSSIAERETVFCVSAEYAGRCSDWLMMLRRKSQFALHVSEQISVLPHSKEMKVQVGGMLGLCKLFEIETGELHSVPNIFEVLEVCGKKVANVDNLSFAAIVREVAHFRLR